MLKNALKAEAACKPMKKCLTSSWAVTAMLAVTGGGWRMSSCPHITIPLLYVLLCSPVAILMVVVITYSMVKAALYVMQTKGCSSS